MLRKDFGLEIKSADSAGMIEGYGSTFGGEPDSYGDIIVKGAFADSLAQHRADGTMPLMLWGHNAHELPIGDWTEMEEDSKGLFVKGQLDLDDPVGQRVHKALQRKSVRGLSIGYEVVEKSSDPKRRGVTLLEKVNLWEVSAVNFPANRNSLISAVKNNDGFARWLAGDRPQRRELEDMLKGAFGVSNSEAERMAGVLLDDDRGDRDDADQQSGFDAEAAFFASMSDAPIICVDEDGNEVSFDDL